MKISSETTKALELSSALFRREAVAKKAGGAVFVLAPVLVPDVADEQGDVISAEEIEQAAYDFMEHRQHVTVLHRRDVSAAAKVVESQILRSPTTIAGQRLPAGTWLVGAILRGEAAELVRTKKLRGWSIGGLGVRTKR